jgi:hypothetical protein
VNFEEYRVTKRSIEVTTMEPGGVVRRGFPLTVGIPFDGGVLRDNEPVALQNEEGRRQAVQKRAMERHDDGSVKWLLLDFQADMEPLGNVMHTIFLGSRGPDPGSRINIQDRADMFIVDNGVLDLDIAKTVCNPLRRVRMNGELVSDGGLDFKITSPDGREYRSSDDVEAKFEVEEDGPLRLLLRWTGKHVDDGGNGHFDFVVRMTIYAGNPFIRLDHTFINRLDPELIEVREVAADLPISLGENLSYSVADIYRPPTVFSTADPVRLE